MNIQIIDQLKRKPIYLATLILSGLTLAWYVLYSPIEGKVNRLKNELADLEDQIYQIESSVGVDSSVGEGVQSLARQFHAIENKFPSKEEKSIGLLSDFARGLNIEIIAINVQPKIFYLDSTQQKIEIEDKVCQKCFVSVEMNGSYADIIEYLNIIEEKLPNYLTIERLKINKISGQSSKLKVSLGLTLYLLT